MFKQFKQVNPFKPCRDRSDLVHSAPARSPKSRSVAARTDLWILSRFENSQNIEAICRAATVLRSPLCNSKMRSGR